MIPSKSPLITAILQEYHDSVIGGHSGIAKTVERICSTYYWPNMQKEIRRYVLCCPICQQAKTETKRPAGLLQPLPIPSQVWEDICMDFITALPPTHGYTVILVVIDRLTKFAHFIALKRDFTSRLVAEAFVQNIIKLHGFPRSIVSDRDRVFISKFWKQLFKIQGTTLAMSSAYHPETDGQSEVLNKTLEMYLRCFCFENPRSWLAMLPWAQYWYNTAFHNSIKMSPYKALYGRDPPSLVRYEFSQHDEVSLQDMLISRDKLLENLKANMARSQQFMKTFADKNQRQSELEEGELVLVKLQPYRQHSVALRKNQKLGMRYFGPFKVIKKLSVVAYKLELPEEARIHNVFHISVLKKFRGNQQQHYLPLPLQTTEVGPILEPQAIIDNRVILEENREVTQVLIQWGEGSAAETTWEEFEDFRKAFPHFNLEGKVGLKGESNVMKKSGEQIVSGRNEDCSDELAIIDGRKKLVTSNGQLAKDQPIQELRRSMRERTTNRRWRELG